MNQTEQMRGQEHYLLNRLRQNYAWLIRDGFTTSANNLDEAITEITKLSERVKELEQALSHVKETPKNEHDSEDVLKPSKLVRLTDEDIQQCYEPAAVSFRRFKNSTRGQMTMPQDSFEWHFAQAIQDAMEEKNK